MGFAPRGPLVDNRPVNEGAGRKAVSRGSCLCGEVRFEYARAVTQVGMCHCSQCRKVTAGLLDDDPGLVIGGHIFVGSKAAWDEIAGDAPRFEEGPTAPTDRR